MKNIIILLFVFISIFCKAQLPPGLPNPNSNGYIKYGYVRNDSGHIVALRDTNWLPKYPTQVFWRHPGVDSSHWTWDGVRWNRLQNAIRLTPKSVVFVGYNGQLTEDINRFVYDSAAGGFLGVGKNNPVCKVDIQTGLDPTSSTLAFRMMSGSRNRIFGLANGVITFRVNSGTQEAGLATFNTPGNNIALSLYDSNIMRRSIMRHTTNDSIGGLDYSLNALDTAGPSTIGMRRSGIIINNSGEVSPGGPPPVGMQDLLLDSTAILELYSHRTGFLMPRMITSFKTDSIGYGKPAKYLKVVDTTSGYENIYNGKWLEYAEVLVSRTININSKNVATTNLLTVPSGKKFITTKAIVWTENSNAITIGPSLGIGVASGEDDIIGSVSVTLTANNRFYKLNPKDGAVIALAGDVVKLGIDVGATGTSQIIKVDLFGYFIQ